MIDNFRCIIVAQENTGATSKDQQRYGKRTARRKTLSQIEPIVFSSFIVQYLPQQEATIRYQSI